MELRRSIYPNGSRIYIHLIVSIATVIFNFIAVRIGVHLQHQQARRVLNCKCLLRWASEIDKCNNITRDEKSRGQIREQEIKLVIPSSSIDHSTQHCHNSDTLCFSHTFIYIVSNIFYFSIKQI